MEEGLDTKSAISSTWMQVVGWLATGEEVLEAISVLGRTTTSIVLTSPVERKPLLP